MGKQSSGTKSNSSKVRKTATKKLDALLDTIDTEISDLEQFVETQTSMGDDAALPESEPETINNATDSALDALSAAEGEVEAMLAGKGDADPAGMTAEGGGGPGADKALKELLSTREVDASELLNKVKAQKKAGKDDDDQSFDDLVSELETAIESKEHRGGSAEPSTLEQEPPDDLLGDQEVKSEDASGGDLELSLPGDEISDDLFQDMKLEEDFEEGEEVGRSNPEVPIPEEAFSDDLFEDLRMEGDLKESKKGYAGGTSAQTASHNELAVLISKKMEALVTRLVEERLPELADRMISEKLKKIISSME